MSRLSYFLAHLCQNVGVRIAAPRHVERGVGCVDVHIFLTKISQNSYKMFGKINFKLFLIRCFSIFIFHFYIWVCLHWIG